MTPSGFRCRFSSLHPDRAVPGKKLLEMPVSISAPASEQVFRRSALVFAPPPLLASALFRRPSLCLACYNPLRTLVVFATLPRGHQNNFVRSAAPYVLFP